MEQGKRYIRSSTSIDTREAPAESTPSYLESSSPEAALSAATKREQTVAADLFATLLAQNKERARSSIETYEAATDLITAIDTLLVRHAEKFGFNRDEEFSHFGERTFKEAYAAVTHAAERLSARYFLDTERTKNERKHAAVVTNAREFIELMRHAQDEGRIPQELLARDAFKLIAQNITAISLQDHGSDATTIVELDAQHLMDHDLQGCMQLVDALIEQGGNLSSMDKLLLHQSMVYHRVGYMVPPILEGIAQKGLHGKDLGIPMLAAHYIRTQYDDPSSVWQTIFPAHEFELLHRAVLYQEKKPEGPSDMALQISPTLDDGTREHNIETIVRIARSADEETGV
ncbi:MAG: hypothetical protein RL518_979 [Pseudomonadota bacterium]